MSIFVELAPALYSATAFAAFDPAGGFSIGNARAMMWFSQLAYEVGRRPTIDAVAPQWRFTSVAVFVKRRIAFDAICATCGLIGERPDAVVLAFSGTDPAVLEMLATNLNIRRSPDRDVHSGFQTALEAASAEIEEAVRLSRDGGKPLLITGHSLGGALAVLAAQRADGLDGGTPRVDGRAGGTQGTDGRAGGTPRGVYTFGMPRVGGERFRGGYNARLGEITYRLVHGDDIVARIPPSRSGFRHVGRMLACRRGEKFDAAAPLSEVDCDEPQFAMRQADRAPGGTHAAFSGAAFAGAAFAPPGPALFAPLMKAFPTPFRDHLQDRYFAALAE